MSGSVTDRPFGTLPDGRQVEAYTLSNGSGVRIVVLTYGAILQAIDVPDRQGRTANVTLGFSQLDDYVARSPYFGSVIGRYANRIGGGSFMLDGGRVTLATNWGRHHLHGGGQGFDRRLWRGRPFQLDGDGSVGVTLAYTSADGEEHYPGTLEVEVTYTLTGEGSLRMDYRAVTDRPTVVNLTNHAYFNLAGEGSGSVGGHLVEIRASRFTPVDENLIPTGEVAPLDGTPLDFRTATALADRAHEAHPQLLAAGGYDHNYVLDRTGPGVEPVARVIEPGSGRVLSVRTTEPGLQLYVAQLDGSLIGPSGRPYRAGDAFTLETQHFPDSPNRPDFPSTVLRPGEQFASTTIYEFSAS